jgi:hypothetical protein
MDFRFTLNHAIAGSKTISQPDGWKGSKIELERHKDFYSLIEHYEGAANGAFIFYGSNNVVDGGVQYIKSIEKLYGFDTNIEFEAEFSDDDINYQNIFTGLLDIAGKNEMVDNKVQIPIIREDFWAKFINRMDTPVDLSKNVDLDGNVVSACEPINVSLTPQKIRKKYDGHLDEFYIQFEGSDWSTSNYLQLDMTNVVLDEIDKKYSIPTTFNGSIPAWLWEMEEDGDCTFDLRIEGSARVDAPLTSVAGNTYVRWYLKINEDSATVFNETNHTSGSLSSTVYSYLNTLTLRKGDVVRIYGDIIADIAPLGVNAYYFIWSDRTTSTPSGAGSGVGTKPTYFRLSMDTTYPESIGQGYLIHDLFYGVLQRMGLGNTPFYSEFLGGLQTNSKTYAQNGCGWMYAIIKGLQIRNYSLTEKPFFISFKQIWDGINPILNLGLGYEVINGINTIVINEKAEYFDENCSIYFDNVRDIESSYDNDHIFKKINTGYKKWESENISGIDDPQTKSTYATRFIKNGVELDIESGFVAASLAIETTRRVTRKKSADYKFDNDVFIIALNENDLSPDRYVPELDENFDSITGLLNYDTRYNSVLTSLRSLLRWANLTGGCLQRYLTSSYKFVSGEGNYDMEGDYSCAMGNQCQAVVCDPLQGKDDIPLSSYNTLFGFLFYPMIYRMNIPMTWDEFLAIQANPKKAIAVSQTDENHFRFFIQKMSYDIVKAQAEIKAWPKGPANLSGTDLLNGNIDLYPDIEVIEPPYVPVTGQGPIERSEQDSDDD